MNINEYISKKLECEELDDDRWNEEFWGNIDGVPQSSYLVKILHFGKKHRSINCVLPKIFEFCDKNSINDAVFNAIKHYPLRKVRNSIFISIAHCPLSFYQYNYINSLKICVEAFAALLDIYIYNACFSAYDLERLINDNPDFIGAIDIHKILSDCNVSPEKHAILRYYEGTWAKEGEPR